MENYENTYEIGSNSSSVSVCKIDNLAKTESSKRSVRSVVILTAVVMLALFLIGWWPRHQKASQAIADMQHFNNLKPRVDVIFAKKISGPFNIRLPADAKAFQETAIFPRATGYLAKLNVNIGEKVEVNQVLAEIDSPELKAQLAQAEATAAKNKNDSELTSTTLRRYEVFARGGGITAQQLDEKKAAEKEALATYDASIAEAERLKELIGFTKIVAPFSGTITSRNFDLGALLVAGASGKEIFTIAHLDTIKFLVNVPQQYAAAVKAGQKAKFTTGNFPGREFLGTVSRTTSSLDKESRTLYTEIDMQNQDGAIMPGMYGEISLEISRSPILTLPSGSVIFDSQGTKVATVSQGVVELRPVKLGRNYGTEIEIVEGVSEKDTVVANPGEKIGLYKSVEINEAKNAP